MLLLNTVITLVVLNLVALAVTKIAGAFLSTTAVEDKYGEKLRKAYPKLSEEDRVELLAETWERPVLYEPYTQFKERPYMGRFVNVSAFGHRLRPDEEPLPLHPEYYNIFVFGGSTTFGYGVSDSETIPAYLQTELAERVSPKIRVFNFGRGFYFSSQERILFQQLLESGMKPQAAIFIDGLNDFVFGDGTPQFTGTLAAFMSGDTGQQAVAWYARLPVFEMLRLFQGQNPNVSGASVVPTTGTNTPVQLLGDPAVYNKQPYLDQVIERYLENKKMIQALGGLYGTRTLFVWQPVPTYKYDLSQHIFAESGFGVHSYSAYGYPLMKQRFDKNTLGWNFIWCADVQENVKKLLYVDLVHYSPELNHMIATCIARQISERRLVFVPM